MRRAPLACCLPALLAALLLAPPASADDDSARLARLSMERQTCGGESPGYTLTIDGSGLVTFVGTAHVRAEGLQTARVDPAAVAALVDEAVRIGFFDFRDEYLFIKNPDGTETHAFDLPTVVVSVTSGGRTKRVTHYIGGPPGLRELEERIDAVAGSRRWIRIDRTTLERLASSGAPPSPADLAEWLRKALGHDEVDVVEALLALGADANGSYHGTETTPLMMVRSGGAARALLAAGAMPNVENANGYTPLGWAAHLEPAVTRVLLDAGAVPDGRVGEAGATALWTAACAGNVDVVALLLERGASPAVTAYGRSALECARTGRRDERSIRRPEIPETAPRWSYRRDFDATIAVLDRAEGERRSKR